MVFLESLDLIRREYDISLFGYVIMPEHVHLVMHPPDGVVLGQVIGRLKSLSARRIITMDQIKLPEISDSSRKGQRRRVFWQPRCYDHNCRIPLTVSEKIVYCHKNPVVRRLVAHPGEWEWSSYNWYCGQREVPLSMDEVEG